MPPHQGASNFSAKPINVESLRKATDMSGVMQIAHDIKIGFSRYDMFVERFDKQKRLVQNSNFKLVQRNKGESVGRTKEQLHDSVASQLKHKQMVHSLHRLHDVG